MKIAAGLLSLLFCSHAAVAFDYMITGIGSVELDDVETEIPGIKTIFLDDVMSVSASGIAWEFKGENAANTGELTVSCEATVDGQVVSSGTMSLADVERELPTSMDCGTFSVSNRGAKVVEVTLTLDGMSAGTSRTYQAFGAGTSIIPLLLIIILAATTSQVELSLSSGIFVGACIIQGELMGGFISCLEDYILDNLADVGHGYVYLFILFMSGLVGMLERSGGM